MEFTEDFKDALKNLPDKEKDKLLLRLLKKDLKLARLLHSNLLDHRSVEERRQAMEVEVLEKTNKMIETYYSPGYLMMDMRFLSGEISEHLRLTKDKFGEVILNLLMLSEVLKKGNKIILEAKPGKSHKLILYIIARTFKLLVLSTKLHEDFLIDLQEGFRELGMLIGNNHSLMKAAIYNGLDVNWLIRFDIPEDIEFMHKELRANGFLK